MAYRDLRTFLTQMEKEGQLRHITESVDPALEMTEICRRVLAQNGPALWFDHPKAYSIPVVGNLFGSPQRVCAAMGAGNIQQVRELGKILAWLKEPEPPSGLREIWEDWHKLRRAIDMAPRIVKRPLCQEEQWIDDEVDLGKLPIQTCWPGDAAPLITWGLVITRGPLRKRQNLGIYRQQVIGRNRLIMRWLSHRGGALDYQAWKQAFPDQPFPVAVAIGADPATLLGAVTPVPDQMSEYAFAGLLRGERTEISPGIGVDLQVPARAEIILEGHIHPNDTALEGPYGDHTGYYNEVERFPVFTVDRITHRANPIYHSTYTGRPPDEPAVLGEVLNELFIPILIRQFPEIIDFYLPPEACSYRLAVISIRKQYAGHAQRVMMAVWSYLRQFMYTKFIIVVDDDIDIRCWQDIIWAVVTRCDPERDTLTLRNSPIDYLDFAAPKPGLGGKMGFDATHKWAGEVDRPWGENITMSKEIIKRVDEMWDKLNLHG